MKNASNLVFFSFFARKLQREPIYKLLMDYLQTSIFTTKKQGIERNGEHDAKGIYQTAYHCPLNAAAFLP